MMQDQWCHIDRSCAKRSNEECAGLCAKRQRRVQGPLEEAAERGDFPQIRGGSSRPTPPPLGSPPNRDTSSGSQANIANPPGDTAAQTNTSQKTVFIIEDDDHEEEWRSDPARPAQVAPVDPKPSQQVGNPETPLTPVQEPPHLPTPPETGPSNQKQGAGTDAWNGAGASTPPTATAFSIEEEILHLFDNLQRIVFLWVQECLPDTFPDTFEAEKPERYWELCGWTRPMSLGNTVLHDRTLAKYVYESWVWRLLHQEIFQLDSLAWAGGDIARESGGLGGTGNRINNLFKFIKKGEPKIHQSLYQGLMPIRRNATRHARGGGVSQDQKDRITGWLVEEMLVAFHPYFPEEYQPIENPQNIEVLIRDTMFLITKAQELDEKLRSAAHVYEMVLGKAGDVVRISGVLSPKMEGYWDPSSGARILHDNDFIALIVVPGLVRNVIYESPNVDPLLGKTVCRNARAFTQQELADATTIS